MIYSDAWFRRPYLSWRRSCELLFRYHTERPTEAFTELDPRLWRRWYGANLTHPEAVHRALLQIAWPSEMEKLECLVDKSCDLVIA